MSSEARERLHPQYQGAPERNHRALPVGSLIHTAFCANRSTVVNRRVRPPEASAQRESRARRLENIGNQQAKARVECERRRLPLSSTRRLLACGRTGWMPTCLLPAKFSLFPSRSLRSAAPSTPKGQHANKLAKNLQLRVRPELAAFSLCDTEKPAVFKPSLPCARLDIE